MYVEESNMVISGGSDSTIRIWKILEPATKSGTPRASQQQGADSDQDQEAQPQQREEKSRTPPPQQVQRTKSFMSSQRSSKTVSTPGTTPTQTKKHTFVKDFFRSKK